MTSRKSQWLFGIIAAATMAGCASAPSGVVPAGQDAYHVSAVGARYETQADTNLKALSVANHYCDQMDKHVMFRQSTETSEHACRPSRKIWYSFAWTRRIRPTCAPRSSTIRRS